MFLINHRLPNKSVRSDQMCSVLYFEAHPGLFRYWSVIPFIGFRHGLPYHPPERLQFFRETFNSGIQKESS